MPPENPPAGAPDAKPFRTMKGKSVLDTLKSIGGAGGSIFVRGAEEDPSPVTVKRSGEAAAEDDSRYQILGEIARGGIGIVYRGRDKDLNRDIAIKVLREEYVQRQDVVQRFVEEAQVGGQLQHPGIVPIYGIGLQADGRPSFAMKLIKGQTLAELLESNPKAIDLVAVFEQIAQTMAYAHSRRVIHRDLKPANVMIGAFGEVQVVDWGFAKILGQEETIRAPERSMIASVRSGAEGSHSLAGSVMGTPAYMPPEQAMGNIAELDERCDVFSLGAILCEIFTGKAPYTGTPKDQLIAATQCRLQPAHDRLAAADAPDGLKQIVRDCLQPLTADRPKNARIVAERLSSYMASVQERARQAELEALASETRSTRDRKARKRTMILAGVILLAILASGGGYLVWKRDRDERRGRAAPAVAGALREAIRHEGEESWGAALAAAQRAADIAASEGVDDAGAKAVLARLESSRVAAERATRIRGEDDELLAELVAIRNLAPGSTQGAWKHPGDRYKAMDAAYVAAFEKRFGSVAASASRLTSSRHAADFAANLGYWCLLRKTMDGLKGSDWAALDLLARRVDPGNEDIRDALLAADADALRIAVEKRGDMLPLALVSQVAAMLIEIGRPEEAIAFLLPWNRRHPDEMMLHIRIAQAARQMALAEGKPERLEVAIRHATAAIALRPEVDLGWYNLGLCLASAGELDKAVLAFLKVLELTPGYLEAYDQLAEAQVRAQGPDEALATVERALKVSPKDSGLRLRKGLILADHLQRYDEASAVYREVIALSPEAWPAYTNLAIAQARSGDPRAAKASLEKALGLEPNAAGVHAEAARGFLELGDLDSAVQHGRRALELDQSLVGAHITLGHALEKMGESEAAVAEYRKAIKLSPGQVAPYVRLSGIYLHRGEVQAALEVAEQAVEVSPRSAVVQAIHAAALLRSGSPAAARDAAERALELDPRVALSHVQLASVLVAEGKLDEALEACRKAIELDSSLADAHRLLARIHARRGTRAAALAAHERVVALDGEAPAIVLRNLMELGTLHEALKDWPAALAEYEKAARLDPKSFPAHMQIGGTRLRTKDFDGAVAAFTQAVKLDEDHAQARALLGYALWLKGDVGAAEAALVKSRELGAADTFVLALYGELLLKQGRPDEAVLALEKAIEALEDAAFCPSCHRYHPPDPSPHRHFLLGEAYARVGRGADAIEAYRASLNFNPSYEPSFTGLALAHASRGEGKAAVAMYRKSVQLAPTQARVRALFALQLARVGEFEEAIQELALAAEAAPEYAAALTELRQQVALAPRLEAVLKGDDKPKGASETLAFAELAQIGQHHDGSVKLFAEALRADPSLAADPKQRLYFQAARAAAQAGEAGQTQALGWLRKDLEGLKGLIATERAFLRHAVACLKEHVDLVSVRDCEEPSEEWTRYWADVDALIRRLREVE